MVDIYEIPDDLDHVKTIGYSFHPNVPNVETVELRESFKRAIAMFPRIYVYD